jgi:hypothetical protein
MKTKFLSKLIYEDIVGGKYIRLYKPFRYYSEILDLEVEIPSGFICDLESVKLIKGTSNRGGVAHDYWSRKDSVPVVSKQKAASLYLEIQICRDNMLKEGFFKRLDRAFRRRFKTIVVRIAPGYFHKRYVLDPLEKF